MRTIIIPFLPRYNRENISEQPVEKLVNAAWQFSQCALWPEQTLDLLEDGDTRAYIREYFTAATDKKRAFTALIQRVILTQKYVRRDRERFLPQPSIWFNRRYPFGFAGTLPWLHNVEQQRKEVPGYLAHIEALAHGYYDYIVRPSTRRFNRCREKMLRHRANSLLQLFYNTVIHLNYVRA